MPIKTLLDITNELPETRITLSVDGQSHAKIKTDLGDYNLMARQPDDFPATPDQIEAETISIQGAIFKEIIDKTVFAVSRDELKPSLTGVLFQISDEGLTAVSTDGHRLVKHSRSDYVSEKKLEDIVVPKKFLNYWKPCMAIFIDSEIWPNTIHNLNKRKVPTILLNARITRKSFKRWCYLGNFGKKIFHSFTYALSLIHI